MNKIMAAMLITLPSISLVYANQIDSASEASQSNKAVAINQSKSLQSFESAAKQYAVLASSPNHSVKKQAKEQDAFWVSLDSSQEPGSEASFQVDAKMSSSQRTVGYLNIPGFWVSNVRGEDGEYYHKIHIPGLGDYGEEGAPSIPVMRLDLVVPEGMDMAKLHLEHAEVKRFSGANIYPLPIQSSDDEEDKFYKNEKIYQTKANWPSTNGVPYYKGKKTLRSIPSITAQVHPVQWNPVSKEFSIAASSRYVIEHSGDMKEQDRLPQHRGQLAELKYHNWSVFKDWFKINWLFFGADYLFVYPDSDHRDELLPLINQKKARGFKVTELKVSDIGSTCSDIRTAINNWESNVPFYRDAYALLVGDTDEIPLCTSPTGDQTDDLYASTNGDDLDEEIFLGRLSIDSEADLENQVSKILAYEDNPSPFCCYHRAVLWAHKENAPNKYEGAHETVRTNSYSNPPSFVTYYGSKSGVDDADIVSQVNSGAGVVAYRGHGSSSSTATGWNQSNEYFNGSDVSGFTNSESRSPVVWSFACTNSNLDSNDSIAEKWMEEVGSGAVSYYGATRTSGTLANHVLDEWMFKAVYDENLTTQSHAIQRAEDQMININGGTYATINSWAYLLLGDPDLQIRRKNVFDFKIEIPRIIERCPKGGCFLQGILMDDSGNPIPNVQVSLFQDGKEIFQANRYTGAKGEISIPYSNLESGKVQYNVRDNQGNTANGFIEVQ